MPANAQAAEIFRGIADLLDLTGEKFKPEAYRRAARSIETLTEDLAILSKRGGLRSIPGVGEAISEKIEEYLSTGRISYYDRLQEGIPAGVVALMHLPGLGPKTARRFWVEFGIAGPSELALALRSGTLDGAVGFGPRRLALFRKALERLPGAGEAPARRLPIRSAYPVAERLVGEIRRRVPEAERVEPAGSLRRCRETIGDLDVLVSSLAPGKVFDTVAALPEVVEVVLRGDTKQTVLLSDGLQVDVRVVEPEAFGAALQYFTGSKEHNVHLRRLARDLGLKVNEYGVYRGAERVAGRTEVDVYQSLGLSYIPPELREDRGEIEAASRQEIPALVEVSEIRGELHWHVPADADVPLVDRVLAEARRRRFEYVGAVVENRAENGTPAQVPDEVRERLEEARQRQRPGEPVVWLVRELGAERRNSPLGSLDYTVLSAGPAAPPVARRAGTPRPWVVAHLGAAPDGGATLGRWRAWIDWARSAGAAIEVGADGLDSAAARDVREHGGLLSVATGLSPQERDPTLLLATGFARRAWASSADVRNTAKRAAFPRSFFPREPGG